MTLDAPHLKAKDAPDLAGFDWADPLRLSDQLSDDERMIADSARAYCAEKLQPRIIKAFAEEHTDPEIFREMGEMGLLGTTIPEEYGGLGGRLRLLRPGCPRSRACGQRLSLDDERAILSGDVPDLRLWL